MTRDARHRVRRYLGGEYETARGTSVRWDQHCRTVFFHWPLGGVVNKNAVWSSSPDHGVQVKWRCGVMREPPTHLGELLHILQVVLTSLRLHLHFVNDHGLAVDVEVKRVGRGPVGRRPLADAALVLVHLELQADEVGAVERTGHG